MRVLRRHSGAFHATRTVTRGRADRGCSTVNSPHASGPILHRRLSGIGRLSGGVMGRNTGPPSRCPGGRCPLRCACVLDSAGISRRIVRYAWASIVFA